MVTDGLARSLKDVLPKMQKYPASRRPVLARRVPYAMGDVLKQPDLARTLERIAARGPAGFYEGETARAHREGDGARTAASSRAKTCAPTRPGGACRCEGTYRGYDVLAMPPPSSGGRPLIEMLNILEGYDLASTGFGSAATVHLLAEAMRRAFADRARYLGDPDANPEMPIERLISKEYAGALRGTIREDRASVSSPDDLRVAGGERGDHPPLGGGPATATRWPSPTRSRTATARRSWCRAPASCSTTRWATSTRGPGLTTRKG